MTVQATRNNPEGGSRARSVSEREFRVETLVLPPWTHPEVVYWYPIWCMIRDAIEGEEAVKRRGIAYLPKMEGMNAAEYAAFKLRATFYNFTGRTISALSGVIFRREAIVQGVPKEMLPGLERFTRDNLSLMQSATASSEEVLAVSRIGLLLDLPQEPTTAPVPYACAYTAENILDWDPYITKDGHEAPERIVLREGKMVRDTKGARQFYATYLELKLELQADGTRIYRQYRYVNPKGNADAELTLEHRKQPITPTRMGEPLDFIPFHIIGPFKSTLSVEKPSAQDLAALNMSHYRSYAALEHGRYFTGFPIYTLEDSTQGALAEADYEIAPSRLWKIPQGSKASILEFNGQGLKHLENACDIKEQQAANIGARQMGVRGQATSESDNQLKLGERNEQSVLLKTARSLDAAYTQLVRWWAWWQGATSAEVAAIDVEFNKDFLFDNIGAREFRAIHAMYKDGVVPIEVVYHYLKKGAAIPDWMTVEEFKTLLDKMESFPNNPDFEARQEGYPTKQSQIDDENADADRDSAEKQAADAAKAAAKAKPPVAGPGGAGRGSAPRTPSAPKPPR